MENIHVAVRLRPRSKKEEDAGEVVPWKIRGNCIEFDDQPSGVKKLTKPQFIYDHCFGTSTNNEQVYSTCVRRVTMSCLEGYNGTIFMYGQTGSGKTYSMLGYKNQDGGVYNQSLKEDLKTTQIMKEGQKQADAETDSLGMENLHEKYPEMIYDSNKVDISGNTGVLIQSLKDIFESIERDEERTFFLKCSYFEIYNDQIYDLLQARGSMHEPLNLMEDAKKDHFMIKGLTEHSVASIKEIFEKLKKGEVNRHYAQTFMNHSSSRSHTLFRITVKAVTNSFIRNFRHENKGQSNVNVHNLMADLNHESEGTVVTESYLNFVDLAGSERINSHMKWVDEEIQDNIRDNKKNLQESRMKEGRSINKSLFFLTQVISLKAEGKANQHIPFRNSPLTKILRSSLGGNFRTLVILCVNPCLSQHEISMSTLRFGQNAKKIQNSIKANIVTNNNDESIKILIENYEKKMRDLQQQRDEDLLKYQQYVHIIDELSIQRSILLERLEQANKKLSVHIVDEMPEATLLNFFKQASTKLAVTYEAGLLFVPESQKKYDKVHEADADDASSNKLKQTFDREMRANSKDVVNRFALQAYNRTRREFDIIKDHVDKQESYLQELSQSFKSVWDFIGQMSHLGSNYLEKLFLMSEQYQEEFIVANERQMKLEFYEKFKGMSLLSDRDLTKMKQYVSELGESIKSESDRRQLLQNSADTSAISRELADELAALKSQEQSDQDSKFTKLRESITNFIRFREGCASEIDYYKQMYKEFKSQTKIDSKPQEIQDFVKTMGDIKDKISKLNSSFKEFDSILGSEEKQNVDKKLAEYQTKFDKLVDVVLAQTKLKKIAKLQKTDDDMSDVMSIGPEASVKSTKKPSILRKSHSITLEDHKSVKDSDEGMKPQNKIKAWLTLKQIEEEPLSYGCMIRDDESVLARSIRDERQNLATINEYMSQAGDDHSEHNFSVKGDSKHGEGMPFSKFSYQKGKSMIVKEPIQQANESPNMMFSNQKRKSKFEERRSHIVGRTALGDIFGAPGTDYMNDSNGSDNFLSPKTNHASVLPQKSQYLRPKTQVDIQALGSRSFDEKSDVSKEDSENFRSPMTFTNLKPPSLFERLKIGITSGQNIPPGPDSARSERKSVKFIGIARDEDEEDPVVSRKSEEQTQVKATKPNLEDKRKSVGPEGDSTKSSFKGLKSSQTTELPSGIMARKDSASKTSPQTAYYAKNSSKSKQTPDKVLRTNSLSNVQSTSSLSKGRLNTSNSIKKPDPAVLPQDSNNPTKMIESVQLDSAQKQIQSKLDGMKSQASKPFARQTDSPADPLTTKEIKKTSVAEKRTASKGTNGIFSTLRMSHEDISNNQFSGQKRTTVGTFEAEKSADRLWKGNSTRTSPQKPVKPEFSKSVITPALNQRRNAVAEDQTQKRPTSSFKTEPSAGENSAKGRQQSPASGPQTKVVVSPTIKPRSALGSNVSPPKRSPISVKK